jgi:hypothetical protein
MLFSSCNLRTTVKLIACADDGETVYAVELACETCGEKLDNAPLDLWLTREFPLVHKCRRCGGHTVVNFVELETQIDHANERS